MSNKPMFHTGTPEPGRLRNERQYALDVLHAAECEIERLTDWLRCIHDLLDEEIGVRFRTSSYRSEEEVGKNSRVYALLSPLRNMARTALKGEPYIKQATHQQQPPEPK